MGASTASVTLDQVWDAIDDVVDAAGRVASRFRTTLSNAHRVARAYRAASVPSQPPVVSDDGRPEPSKPNASRFYMVRKGDSYVVTDGKHASVTSPTKEAAEQVLNLVWQLEREQSKA